MEQKDQGVFVDRIAEAKARIDRHLSRQLLSAEAKQALHATRAELVKAELEVALEKANGPPE